MGYPLQLAARYLSSKKRAFISVGTAFAIIGVALGVAALTTVASVTGGFQAQFRDKVLGVNADVLVLKYSTDFREYRDVMAKVAEVPGVVGVGPFVINPMMVSRADKTATGVLVKGIDPDLMPTVLDLPKHIISGKLAGLRREGAAPPPRRSGSGFGGAVAPTPRPASSAGAGGKTGGVDGDDAGRKAFLREIENSIREGESRPPVDDTPVVVQPPLEEPKVRTADAHPAKSRKGSAKGRADRPGANDLPRGAPRGSIVPDGGYRSQLPDDDTLPADVAPDPCASPDAVRKMPGIVVGVTLAKNLGASIGDCLEVTSPMIGFTFGHGSLKPPVAKRFRVVAVFEAGFDQYDSKLVYTDLYEAQSFYDEGDTVTGVEMKVKDVDKARAISRTIDKLLANGLYHTMDWEELNHGLFTALTLQKITMSLVMGLIILIAMFTVIATLVMVVLDKKREISVLKAMGATNGAILRIFIYQGGSIGLIGTTAGLAIGIGICKILLVYGYPLDPKVYFISRLPVQVSPIELTMFGIGAMLVCLLCTIPPALYAAWSRPADGIRAE